MVEPQDYLVPIASRDSQDRNDLSRFDGRGEHLRALVTEHIHRGVVTGKLRDHPLREFRDLCGRRITTVGCTRSFPTRCLVPDSSDSGLRASSTWEIAPG